MPEKQNMLNYIYKKVADNTNVNKDDEL